MIKKLIVTLFLLFFTNLTVLADCVTGYACSLKELQEQETVNQNRDMQNKKEVKQQQKKAKEQGIFVDGKENNSPKYTEMFTLKGIIP